MTIKQIGNIIFYVILIAVSAYLIKRKFIVPQIPSEDLLFQDYEGNDVDLSSYPDKTVVVNFWQTWCSPCLHEMPSLNEMNQVWDELQVICISDEPLSKVQQYITLYPNIKFLSVKDISNFGVSQFPTTYIYNSKGTKVFSKIGSKDWADPNFIANLKKNWSN
jgi:thiol-disulfide isomerase/thioredoxin